VGDFVFLKEMWVRFGDTHIYTGSRSGSTVAGRCTFMPWAHNTYTYIFAFIVIETRTV
jgi:hypothetical protein